MKIKAKSLMTNLADRKTQTPTTLGQEKILKQMFIKYRIRF